MWTLPQIVDQYSESGAEEAHIQWVNVNDFSHLRNLDGKSVVTVKDLLHIARDPKHDIMDKTYYLRLTNFNFQIYPEILSGIEVKITMNRAGRITDDTVQLCLNNQLIGKNLATLELSPMKIYGGSSDTWNSNITAEDIKNPSFGVVLRFKSHPAWPHRSSPLIDAVELKIT